MKKMNELNSADRRERKFLIAFLAVTVLLVVFWITVIAVKVGFGQLRGRTNSQQDGTARVYDYADMLTDAQEEALEEKIDEVQKRISADIVIVIINESLEEKYPDLVYSKYDETDAYRGIQRYAESFWIEQGFGWNEAGNTGNGIIMVDNIYRESNGWVYNWVAGSGDLRYSVGDSSCEDLSQTFTNRLPYGDMPHYSQTYADALTGFVEDCDSFGSMVKGMLGWSLFTPSTMYAVIASSFLASVVVIVMLVLIFGLMLWHLSYNGKRKPGWKDDAPFARTDVLEPDTYDLVVRKDIPVRRYTTSYTVHHDSGGRGGGSFGGGFSGGGGGGGGFSGGGSHR